MLLEHFTSNIILRIEMLTMKKFSSFVSWRDFLFFRGYWFVLRVALYLIFSSLFTITIGSLPHWRTDCTTWTKKEQAYNWDSNISVTLTFSSVGAKLRGTQREILRKRPKNNNKAWIKFSETISSILGDCWKKSICSSLPARMMEEFPASNLTTCNLTYWEVS